MNYSPFEIVGARGETDDEVLGRFDKELLGTTVLEKPRVSREVSIQNYSKGGSEGQGDG